MKAKEESGKQLVRESDVKIESIDVHRVTKIFTIKTILHCPHRALFSDNPVDLTFTMDFFFKKGSLIEISGDFLGKAISKDKQNETLSITGSLSLQGDRIHVKLIGIESENSNANYWNGNLEAFGKKNFLLELYDDKNRKHSFIPSHSGNKNDVEIEESYDVEYEFSLIRQGDTKSVDSVASDCNKSEEQKTNLVEIQSNRYFVFRGKLLNDTEKTLNITLSPFQTLTSIRKDLVSILEKIKSDSFSFQGSAFGVTECKERFLANGILKLPKPEKEAKNSAKELKNIIGQHFTFTSISSQIFDISKTPKNLVGVYSDANEDNDPGFISRGENFTIFFDSAYFKYLPDLWNTNEVVVIFTFQEGDGPSDQKQKTYRILGPMENIGDKSLASYLGMVLYGPKRFNGDKLTVNIQIIELDAKEKQDRKKFISFFSSAAETFSLANPVTQVELQIAAQIAHTFNEFDQDDKVLDYTFELLPTDFRNIPRHEAIPVKLGNYAIVKQEQVKLFNRYYHLTRNQAQEYYYDVQGWRGLIYIPVFLTTFIIDTAIIIPQTLVNIFRDVPDGPSIAEIQFNNPNKGNKGEENKANQVKPHGTLEERYLRYSDSKRIYFDPTTKFLVASERDKPETRMYDSKTWITFSIEKGRQATVLERQTNLSQIEKQILETIKGASMETEEYLQKLTELGKALQKAKREEINRKSEDKKNKEELLKKSFNQ